MSEPSKFYQAQFITPETVCFDQSVKFVAATAIDGEVGILAGHAPFLCELANGALRVQMPDETWHYFFLGSGIMKVKDNRLAIITREVIPGQNIDQNTAQNELSKIQERTISAEYNRDQKNSDLQRYNALLKVSQLYRQSQS